MEKLFLKFKQRVEKEGTPKAAVFFGYKTSAAIDQWIIRKSIPLKKLDGVKQFLQLKGKEWPRLKA